MDALPQREELESVLYLLEKVLVQSSAPPVGYLWTCRDKKNQAYNRMAAYDWIGTNPEPILKWFDKYVKN